MKKIISLSLVLMMALSVNAQLLWKISGNGLKDASYILGTHHACSFTFCDSILGLKKAFDQAQVVVGEIDMLNAGQMSQEEQLQLQSLMLMPSDTTLMSLFSQEEMALIDKYLLANLGANLQQLSMLKPMSILVTLQNKILMEILPTMATMTGMDTYMQQLAAKNAKEVGALETMSFQLNLLYASSLEEQADALLEMARTDNM
ncbi:MAG: TraB/GumN family protein, partial [Bacteroidales bacterium]|nr:TraB/GumN family protein [Bacteroidales bacterium]